MARRLASGLLLLCFFVTLLLAAGHNHIRERTSGCSDAACVLCSGAIATAPAVPLLERAPLAQRRHLLAAPRAPVLPSLLKLDHSGGAPPLA